MTADMNMMLRLPDVLRATGVTRSTLYRNIREGLFPPPTKVGKRASAWPRDEVRAWQEERRAARAKAA